MTSSGRREAGREADGRSAILAFWLLYFRENSHELTSMEAMFGWVFGKVKSAIFRFKNAKFSSRGSAPHPAGASRPRPPLYRAPPSVSKGPSTPRECIAACDAGSRRDACCATH